MGIHSTVRLLACAAGPLAAALAGCASGGEARRTSDYSPELAPHSAPGPVELRLLGVREGPDHLRLRVRLDNRSGTPVELKAADWQSRWAEVTVAGHALAAEVSVPANDPDSRWPDERPLRRDAEVPAYRSSDFLIDCHLDAPLADDAAIALSVRASLGGAPLALSVRVPQPR